MANKPMHLTYLSVALHGLTGGRAYDGDETSPAGFLKLTTTGRKTGQVRISELIYLRNGDNYVVTASAGGRPKRPGWFYNAQSNQNVELEVHRKHMPAVARVATPEEHEVLWARLTEIAPMYLGYEKRLQREIPMLVLTPSGE